MRIADGMRRARLRGCLLLQVDDGQVFEQVHGTSTLTVWEFALRTVCINLGQ